MADENVMLKADSKLYSDIIDLINEYIEDFDGDNPNDFVIATLLSILLQGMVITLSDEGVEHLLTQLRDNWYNHREEFNPSRSNVQPWMILWSIR
jgi:hypothetical protein